MQEIQNIAIEDVDVQLAENENIDNIPEDPSNTYATKRELLAKTKIVKQTWSILEIYQKTKSGRLNLSPDYQRNNIWKIDKQTAFIESLFMGIIIPPIYVVEIPGTNMLEESSYEVVDGKQRLTTIKNFLTNEIALHEKALEYYTDWFGGKRYVDITSEYKELTNAMLSSVLDIYVITANSPEFTKYDIFSRLLNDRIIFLSDEVNDTTASLVIAQMLYLEGQDPDKDINFYINSPGGSVSAGMAIYDTMQYIKCDVSTICMGMAASMGAFLLSAGAKGKRLALPNSEIMIHQPLGGAKGQATEILIAAKHIERTRANLNRILSENTGRSLEEIERDTERDNFMTAQEALQYGLVDKVITKR